MPKKQNLSPELALALSRFSSFSQDLSLLSSFFNHFSPRSRPSSTSSSPSGNKTGRRHKPTAQSSAWKEKHRTATTTAAVTAAAVAAPAIPPGRREGLRHLIVGNVGACLVSESSETASDRSDRSVEVDSGFSEEGSSDDLANFGDLASFPSDSDIDDPDFLPPDDELEYASSQHSSDSSDVRTLEFSSENAYDSDRPYGPHDVPTSEESTDHPSMYGSDEVSDCGESTRPDWHSPSCDSGSSGLPSQCPGDESSIARSDDLPSHADLLGYKPDDSSDEESTRFPAINFSYVPGDRDDDYPDDESEPPRASHAGQSTLLCGPSDLVSHECDPHIDRSDNSGPADRFGYESHASACVASYSQGPQREVYVDSEGNTCSFEKSDEASYGEDDDDDEYGEDEGHSEESYESDNDYD